MIRSILFALVLGLSGTVVLTALGVWQMQRLAWKEGIIADAETMLTRAPVALPAAPDPVADRYRAVRVDGRFTGQEAHVLTSLREEGPGYRMIAAYVMTDGRQILVDRGFIRETAKDTPRPPLAVEVVGNLNWPDDVTAWTPPYDANRAIWYGRDVVGMATLLGTEPVLVIARTDTGDGILPLPVTTEGFRNNHFEYAMTWFGLAAVWLGMTVYLLWRIRARSV